MASCPACFLPKLGKISRCAFANGGSTQEEFREQIRMTVIHEVGHYFGMDEEQLKDVR